MSFVEILLILLAGVAAGTINTIVGSGSLITFPTLVALGFPPVVANMTNTVGLVGGGVSGVLGYRAELRGAGHLLRRLVPFSLAGGIAGGVLLLVLDPVVFEVVVPLLIGAGVVLVLAGPWLQRRLARRRTHEPPRSHVAALVVGIFLAGVYGGYFGAAQGVILIGIMGTLLTEPLQTLNGVKNVLGLVVNATSALVFVLVAGSEIAWGAVLVLIVGTTFGGVLGARVGRRLPPLALRIVIAVIGVVAIIRMTVLA